MSLSLSKRGKRSIAPMKWTATLRHAALLGGGLAALYILGQSPRQPGSVYHAILAPTADAAEELSSELESYDALLRGLKEQTGTLVAGELWRPDCRQVDAMAMNAALKAVFIVNATGRIICQSPTLAFTSTDVSGTTFFSDAQGDKSDQLTFDHSRPMLKLDGAPSITISRGMHNPHGDFVGIVAGVVSVRHIQQMCDASGIRCSASILRIDEGGRPTDELFLLRHEQLHIAANIVGAHIKYVLPSYFTDAAEGRIHAVYQIGGFPLVLDVSASWWDLAWH